MMFGKRVKLFRVSGIDIRIDWSWAILFILITWSLARGLFPVGYEGLRPELYWWMGIAGALGLFASVLVHELCHALVARNQRIRVHGITLFLLGGVTEMEGEPPSPLSEFGMAIVGPLSSALLAVVLWIAASAGASAGWPLPIIGVLGYLAWINAVVAVFNLLPAFPLDGGRVLRSALWAFRGDVRWATRIASRLGSAFGLLLCAGGLVLVLFGDFVGGIWFFIIGLFLRSASQASYEQLLLRRALAGQTVRRLMRPDPVTVPPELPLDQLVDDYFYRYDHKLFPVAKSGRLLGCVTPRLLREVPRDEWDRRTVADVAGECSFDNTISPDADAIDALAAMSRGPVSRLMVVEDGRLLGVITPKDLLRFVSLRMEMEGTDDAPRTELRSRAA